MCHDCHNELINALLEVPDMGNPTTRVALLATIPNHLSFKRDDSNTTNDLSLLVSALFSTTQRKTGEKPLKIFIDNARSRITGLTLYNRLEELYLKYEHCPLNRQESVIASRKIASKRQGMKLSPAYQLCEPYAFDLDCLVDTFLKTVRESQKIVGFAISCDYSTFLEIFRKRIEDTIRVHKVFKGMFFYMEQPYVLKYDTIKNIIDDVKSRKSSISRKYIYIPIKLGNTGIDKDLLQTFWHKIYEESDIDTQHVLIVVMMGKSNSIFPEGLIPLTPSFIEDDAHDWILNVGTRLMWPPEHVKAKWKAHILTKCLVEGILDMESTYMYMNEVKSILRDEANLSFEKFLCLLEKRSIYL